MKNAIVVSFVVLAVSTFSCRKEKDDGPNGGDVSEHNPGDPNHPGSLAISASLDIQLESGNTLVTFDGNVLPADGSGSPGSLAIEGASLALTQGSEGSMTNLLAVNENGEGYVPITSDFDIDVLFSALHPSGNDLFIALNANRSESETEYNPKSTSNLIASLNCSLLRVSLADKSSTCVKLGLAVLTAPYDHLQRDRKPVQFDAEGNAYFLAGTFARCTGDGGNTPVDHDLPATEGEMFSFCEGIEMGQIYRLDHASGEVKAITQDTERVSFFAVLSTGEVVYQVRDETTKIEGFGSPAKLSLFKDNQTINLSGESPVGISFFATDTDHTVMWGDQDAGGIRFARALEDNRITSAIILDEDVGKITFGNVIPNPFSAITGDDGNLYVVYNTPDPTSDAAVNKFSVMQVLPYDPVPLVTIESKETWLDWVGGHNIQVANGFLFYVEHVDLKDGFGFRDVIRVVKTSDQEVTTLLADSASRFEIYNWQLNDDVLTFSGIDLTKTQVIVGSIDVKAVQDGKPAGEYLTYDEVVSASDAQSQIKDIEVLLPAAPATDPGGAPVAETTFDADTPLAVSVTFSKFMNNASVLAGLTIVDAQNEPVEALPVWIQGTLHLIPDLDGLFGMDQTTMLTAGESYTLSLSADTTDLYKTKLGGTKEFVITVSP